MLNNEYCRDKAALLHEVSSGEIRQGMECGNDPECSWKT